MAENWQIIVGFSVFLVAYFVVPWLFRQETARRRNRRLLLYEVSKFVERQANKEEVRDSTIVPAKPSKSHRLIRVGDIIHFVSIRGKGGQCLHRAVVERVKKDGKSFFLRWLDSRGRPHRRKMTPEMLKHRELLVD